MWTVIGYKEALEHGAIVRIYDDLSEKSFETKLNADEYAAYLYKTYVDKSLPNAVDTYETKVYIHNELDLNELKKNDALAKLTAEEKTLLNLNS